MRSRAYPVRMGGPRGRRFPQTAVLLQHYCGPATRHVGDRPAAYRSCERWPQGFAQKGQLASTPPPAIRSTLARQLHGSSPRLTPPCSPPRRIQARLPRMSLGRLAAAATPRTCSHTAAQTHRHCQASGLVVGDRQVIVDRRLSRRAACRRRGDQPQYVAGRFCAEPRRLPRGAAALARADGPVVARYGVDPGPGLPGLRTPPTYHGSGHYGCAGGTPSSAAKARERRQADALAELTVAGAEGPAGPHAMARRMRPKQTALSIR